MRGTWITKAVTRLAVTCALVFSITACEGISLDLGTLFGGFEPPAAPTRPIYYFDATNTPFKNSARFKSSEWDEASMIASDDIAKTAAGIAKVLEKYDSITVRLEGHADMRCGEAVWLERYGYRNPDTPNGTWCSPREANGVTPQGLKISESRAKTTMGVLKTVLARDYASAVSGKTIAWERPHGLGEEGHQASAQRCRDYPDINPCLRDRRVDILVTSGREICVANCIPEPPCEQTGTCPCEQTGTCPCTDPAGCCVGADCEPPPKTCLQLGNCPNDPPPTLDPVRGSATAFSYAQQNTDQSIRFTLGGLTCDGGEAAPCGDPTSGEMRTGTAGPYLVSSRLSSFVLNAPSGYRSPAQYRIITDPTGASLGSGATAKLRFYAVTRAGAPYSYTATAAVTVQWNTWEWDGSSKTITGSSTETVPVTLTCTPAKTPTCSFGVLGSNVSR